MTSFAIAVAVGSFYPQCQPCLVAVAALIAISRIILGMHFLADVIVGALLGALIAYLSLGFHLDFGFRLEHPQNSRRPVESELTRGHTDCKLQMYKHIVYL